MTIAIHPHEIGQLLGRFPQAACLSLNCFDTLLWRDCHAPADLFAALPGINRGQRADAERRARKAQALPGAGPRYRSTRFTPRSCPTPPRPSARRQSRRNSKPKHAIATPLCPRWT